ncbi:MAG TPA: potassium channel family protein [Candidatus Dormibacteraeota bacterium]|nr:potassium channel family protein [Candidatus Dormibacteraeota bacterium]
MTAVRWIELVVGIVIVVAAFYDLFRSVVLPRPAVNRFILIRPFFNMAWKTWRWIGHRIPSPARRETWLATFGPLMVIVIFVLWALAFLFGYALILDGLRSQIRPLLDNFGESLYFSATTIVPLSYGDFVPTAFGSRVAIIFESATGVGIAALVITLLFSLYAAFQEREELVVQLDAIAGAPPSGVQLLETVFERGLRNELIKTFDEWRAWSAAVLESHLAYPILLYFRSSHDNEAWLNSFGAVMDAAALVLTAVDEDEQGPARLMFTVGNHLIEDLAWYFRFTSTKEPLIERDEFDEAVARLKKAGYRTKSGEEAWISFTHHRGKYASQLIWMADRLAIVPAEWIGDRTYAPHVDGRGRTRRRLP